MRHFFCIVFLAALIPQARAEDGSAEAGRAYAHAVCAQCHAVQEGETYSPDRKSPSFSKIATTPGMTGAALFSFLQTPHFQMPDLIIPEKDKADVVAYILSLKH